MRFRYTGSQEEVLRRPQKKKEPCDLTSCRVAIVGRILRMQAEIVLRLLHVLTLWIHALRVVITRFFCKQEVPFQNGIQDSLIRTLSTEEAATTT